MDDECYDFENGVTDAFISYAEDIIMFEIDDRKYLGKEGKFLSLNNGVTSELELRKLICLYLADKVNSILPNWQDVRRKYNTACSKIPFDEFETKFPKYENKIRTLAKLKYCTEILSELNNFASYDLDTSNYLMVIYYKLSGLVCGQKHTNPSTKFVTTSKHDRQLALQNNNVYGYLHDASLESFSSHINYKELFNANITQLINRLFNYITISQYEYNHTIVEPWLGIDQNGDIKQQYEFIFAIDEGASSKAEALECAEQIFNDWLIDQMHILDNGKIF